MSYCRGVNGFLWKSKQIKKAFKFSDLKAKVTASGLLNAYYRTVDVPSVGHK
jgi:hypothetical protein